MSCVLSALPAQNASSDGGRNTAIALGAMVVGAVIGAALGSTMNRTGLEAVLGGLLGWIIILTIPERNRW